MTDQSIDQGQASYMAAWTFPQNPQIVHTVQHEYAYLQPGSTPCKHTNFLKGAKWSPDGACLLTASDDGWLRVYDLPQNILSKPAPNLYPDKHAGTQQPHQPSPAQMHTTDSVDQTTIENAVEGVPNNELNIWGGVGLRPWRPTDPDTMGAALRVHEGELIYDFAWYSGMSAVEPQSCVFATTTRAHPIHLWDAGTGELRATYRGYNDVDEVTAAFSLAFSPDGAKLCAGYSKLLLLFDVSKPGRDAMRIPCSVRGPGYSAKLPGMVSCLSYSPDGTMLAAGTYSSYIGIFDPRIPEMQLVMQGHKGGLTQVLFTHDGNYLLSGARQDSEVLCWDVRGGTGGGEGSVVYRMQRDTATTNQRIGFSLEPCGRHLLTGGCNGAVKVFDLQTGQLADEFQVAEDTVNGCDAHPCLNLLAVSTGQRHYDIIEAPDADDTRQSLPTEPHSGVKNALRILRLHCQPLESSTNAAHASDTVMLDGNHV